jgi:hypothetical protein
MLNWANRRSGAIAAALLVAGALQHCTMEPIPELASGPGASWLAHRSNPVSHPGCPNESGCICRGATVAGRVSTPEVQVSVWAILERSAGSEQAQAVCEATPLLSGDVHAPAPLSGRQLRARIASFLI